MCTRARRLMASRRFRRIAIASATLVYLALTALNATLFYDRASPAPPPTPAEYAKKASSALDFVSGLQMTPDMQGHAPTAASLVSLTTSQIGEVAAKHATAAIVMGELASESARVELAGLQWELHRDGVKVITVANCDFRAVKEHQRLLWMLANPPDLVFASPVDLVANLDLYRELGARTHLVLLNGPPGQLAPRRQYVAAVMGDAVGAGVASAHLIGLALRGSGRIGVLLFAADPFFAPGDLPASVVAHPPQTVLDDRYSGLVQALPENYPGIQIVAEARLRGPNYASQATAEVASMVATHRNLSAVWVEWGGAASGALQALQSLDRRRRIRVVTFDLDQSLAVGLARHLVLGVSADRSFSIGATAGRVGALAILNERTPEFVEESTLPVTSGNVRFAWQDSYNSTLPRALAGAR